MRNKELVSNWVFDKVRVEAKTYEMGIKKPASRGCLI